MLLTIVYTRAPGLAEDTGATTLGAEARSEDRTVTVPTVPTVEERQANRATLRVPRAASA